MVIVRRGKLFRVRYHIWKVIITDLLYVELRHVTRCASTVQWWEAGFSTMDSSQVVNLEQYPMGPLWPSFIEPFNEQ